MRGLINRVQSMGLMINEGKNKYMVVTTNNELDQNKFEDRKLLF